MIGWGRDVEVEVEGEDRIDEERQQEEEVRQTSHDMRTMLG